MPSPSKFLLKYFPFHCSFFFPSFFPLPRYFLIGIFLLFFCHSHHLLPSSWATWIPHSPLLFAFVPFLSSLVLPPNFFPSPSPLFYPFLLPLPCPPLSTFPPLVFSILFPIHFWNLIYLFGSYDG